MDLRPWLLSSTEAAAVIGVNRQTVNRWADRGQVPCLRTPGGHRRFRREDVEALARSLWTRVDGDPT